MATRVRTTRGRIASEPLNAGTPSRDAAASIRDPLQTDGPRVLIRLPDLTVGDPLQEENRASQDDEPTPQSVESSQPVQPQPQIEQPWPEGAIARTMPGLTTSNVVVQSFDSPSAAVPQTESPRYVSLASAINQLKVSEPADEESISEAAAAEVQIVKQALPKVEPKDAQKVQTKSSPALVQTTLVEPAAVEGVNVVVNTLAPHWGRFRAFAIAARNPKMMLTGLLVALIHLALAMFFVPSGDPVTDAPDGSVADGSGSNVAPSWTPPAIQLPSATGTYGNPATAGQSPAPPFVASPSTTPSTAPSAPNFTAPNFTAPTNGNGHSGDSAPTWNPVPSTAAAPSGNQQTNHQRPTAAPARTGSQPGVAEFEGGIVRPTLETSYERPRQSLR